MKSFIISFLFFSCGIVYSQNTSIRQIQNEIYSKYNFQTESEFDNLNKYHNNSNSALPLNKQVFGWNPYWVGTAYTAYNYNLLSTVGYFSYEVDTATGGYTDIHFWRTTNLVPVAHQYGVKVVLTVTNFGSANNTKILGNAVKRQRLIDSVIALVQFRQADGVNIDFELVPGSQRTNLVTFMTALSAQMHSAIPNSKVSIDLPAVDWNNSFDVPALNSVCDYMLIMGYDYYYSGSPNAGPVSPLQGGSYNITNSVNYYINNGASLNKLILAVPYYGYEWPVVDNTIHSATTGTGTAYVYSSIKTRALTHGRIWDAVSSTPWYRYQSGNWRQGWYDDSVSLGLKYDLVNTRNLAGIGIWALSYDGSNEELWNLINTKFGVTGITPIGNTIPEEFTLYQNYPNPFNPTTKIKFDLPPAGTSRDLSVRLIVYNSLGQEVVTLVNEQLKSGQYEVDWNALNYPSGVYYYKLISENYSDTKKMVIMK